MSAAPEVSVIVPTRNRWHILSRSALPAALMQEEVALEVIVVDDGSTDGTAVGLAAVADERVRVIRNERSSGVSAARNRGIEAARGAWLAFLDDDDVWSPRKLREQVDRAVERGAGFAFSSAVTVDAERRLTAYRGVPEDGDLAGLLLRENVVPGGCSNVIGRTEVVRRLGGFDERLSILADWDLWLRLALDSSAAPCPELHVAYLEHDGNMALRVPGAIFRESRYLAEKHRACGELDRLAPIRWIAWANFWSGRRGRAARILVRAGLAERAWGDVGRGLRFAVWAAAPDGLSQSLRRLLRGRGGGPGAVASPPRPDWLDRYDPVPSSRAAA